MMFQIFDVAALVGNIEPFDDFTYVLTSITPDNGYVELDPVTGNGGVIIYKQGR